MFPARSLSLPNSQLKRAVVRSNQFVRRHPLAFKALPTACGFAFGDFLTQFMQWRNSPQRQRTNAPFQWEVTSAIKMAFVGAVVSVPLLWQLQLLDHGLSSTNGLVANTVKFTLDQVVGCVLWQAAYMYLHADYRKGMQDTLAGIQQSLEVQTSNLTQDVKRKLQLQAA